MSLSKTYTALEWLNLISLYGNMPVHMLYYGQNRQRAGQSIKTIYGNMPVH